MVWIVTRLLFIILGVNFLSNELFAQLNPNSINLLRNGGFELSDNNDTPQCLEYSAHPNQQHQWADILSNEILDWTVAKRCGLCSWGSPDWMGTNCSSSGGTNTTRFMRMADQKELIYSQLFMNGNSYSLIGGHQYLLKYRYVRVSADGSGIEVYLTKHGEHWYETSNISGNQKYHLASADVSWNTSNSSEWEQKILTFTAPTGSDFNDLKNIVFKLKDNSDGNYTVIHLDDVELYEIESCPNVLAIENRIHWQENTIYQAANVLKAGYDVNNPFTDNGNVEVKYNSNIIYRAGNQIILEPGFSTEPGCYFETVIEPCEPNPCPNIPPVLNDVVICDANPVALGNGGAETGLFYSWTPSTYLDNPNSPNPIFTPPPGSGYINYTVTVTSICGVMIDFSTFPITTEILITEGVTVVYNTNPNPVPSVTITNSQTSDYDFNFDFTVGTETEEYCIQVIEQGTNAIAYSNCFDIVPGTCCNFNFNYNMLNEIEKANFSICKDYIIQVSTKNYCFTNYVFDQFDWNRNENLSLISISNVMSIPDAPNEYFKATITGADQFHVYIVNPQGAEVHNQTAIVSENPITLWDGWCDGNQCSFFGGEDCWAPNGTYFYTLDITNQCGGQIGTSGNLTIFHDIGSSDLINCNRSMLIIEDSVQSSPISKNNLLVYPNPTNNYLYIEYLEEVYVENTTVYDNIGRIVFETEISIKEIDLSSFSNGIYFLEIKTDQGFFREKIIKQ